MITKTAGFVSEPYENVFIGNFLYGLGLAIGTRRQGRDVPACVNLLQQGPMDPLLGDVLLEFTGTLRLLEFKRSKNKSGKEHDKARLLRAALSSVPELVPVSRAVHWYVQSIEEPDAVESQIYVSPYIDFGTGKPAANTLLSEFVQELADDALNPDTPRIETVLLKEYLKCVGDWNNAGSVSTGGMLVHIDTTGTLRYVTLDDIRELLLQHRDYIELRMQSVGERTHERELERTREYERTPRSSRGLSR